MTDKGTTNAIFSLRTLMERAIDVQKDLYLCFIDYSKTFDKVKHSDLFDILLRHNCDGKDLRVIRNLYWEQEATIRIDDDCSVYKPICRGVRQGCVFSPDLSDYRHYFSKPKLLMTNVIIKKNPACYEGQAVKLKVRESQMAISFIKSGNSDDGRNQMNDS